MLRRNQYEKFIYRITDHFSIIRTSTLILTPPGLDTAQLTGMLTFDQSIVLCAYEMLDFQQGTIMTYRYEVSHYSAPFSKTPLPSSEIYCKAHYANKKKLYWYDSWPHPNNPQLAITAPHHKHIQPDIKHHRIPAPDLSFTEPNLPFLIREIEQLLKELD